MDSTTIGQGIRSKQPLKKKKRQSTLQLNQAQNSLCSPRLASSSRQSSSVSLLSTGITGLFYFQLCARGENDVNVSVVPRRPERKSDPLQLQLEATVSGLPWVLGTNLRSSRRAEALLSAKPFLQHPSNMSSLVKCRILSDTRNSKLVSKLNYFHL